MCRPRPQRYHSAAPVLHLALLIVSFVGSARAHAETSRRVTADTTVDGLIIASIRIDNRNVFDTRKAEYNNLLFRTANRLRFVTRPWVIRRELLFAEGEPFSRQRADESARNLRLRFTLYDAWVETKPTSDGRVDVTVVTIDQWSLVGGVRASRDARETVYQVGFEERNFLGHNQLVALDYFWQQTEADYGRAEFRDQRVTGRPISFGALFNDNPLGSIRALALGHPYYHLGQRWSAELELSWTHGRRDQYDDSVKIAESRYRGVDDRVTVSYRGGPRDYKIGPTLTYQYRQETTSDRKVLPGATVTFPVDSLYHSLSIGFAITRPVFDTARRLNGFGYIEDLSLDRGLEITYGQARESGLERTLFHQYGFRTQLGLRAGPHIALAVVQRRFWRSDDQTVRRVGDISLRYYYARFRFLTIAARAWYRSDWRPDQTDELVLGGESGLRGYPRFSATGGRRFVGNLEARWFTGLELLSVRFGAVNFLDFGRTWRTGQPFYVRGFEYCVGAGLRVSLERISKGQVLRFDLARTGLGTWEYALGTSQYF